MLRRPPTTLLLASLLVITFAGCGTAAPYLQKTIDVISQIGEAAGAIETASAAIDKSASPFLDENLGTPITEQKITRLDFSGVGIEIKSCNLASNNAECTFILELDESEPSRSVNLTIDRAVTKDGKDVPVAQIVIGTSWASSGKIKSSLISGVPASGRVVFANVPSSLDHFLAMEVGIDGRDLVLRNIPVQK